MKLTRFMLGFMGFTVAWFLVTGLATLVLSTVIPGKAPEPIGVNWAAIPGSFVGAVAGYWVYQMIVRKR